MAKVREILNVHDSNSATVLHETANSLERDAELVLDFSALRRLDSSAVRALEILADIAEERSAKLSLRGLNIDGYKTLKLMKLAHRFSFVD